ncbi:cryptochrome DASH-like [Homarus americanus]|uniref:cryptochrome DASH-like n=1 Tax=Homarus americanus TaxID=6706 RepID=UPI001C496294|nr:cryptochrome DASH-like [Homarus americanus]
MLTAIGGRAIRRVVTGTWQKHRTHVSSKAKMNVKNKSVALCWLRNDLRYHDNEVLMKANTNVDEVVPVYCFDPRHFQETYHFCFSKTGNHRAKFLLQSVQDLRNTLRSRGSDLLVRFGEPEVIIPSILKTIAAASYFVVYQEEVTREEKDVERALRERCKAAGAQIHSFWGSTLYHKNDLPFAVNNIPDTFTGFRKAVEAQSRVLGPIVMPEKLKPLPSGIDLGDLPTLERLGVKDAPTDRRTAFPFSGGETSGLERVKRYFWDSNNVAKYKETRNGLLGEEYSTKLSPWLAHGCLSPRYIFAEIKKYESARIANQSTYWVVFEMIWRDYFKFVCVKYGDRVFYPSGIMGKKRQWKNDPQVFQTWKDGQTGVPFVDANMRELKETGWMSNRGRQNVASFLIKDLGLDWRLGAEWFESQLLDHDVCSNYGNWNYSAGIGNDPRENRKFNMVKQGLDYDPKGEFIRTWVPELAEIRGAMVHTPWKMSLHDLGKAGVSLGEYYPNPVVVAPEWSRQDHRVTSRTTKHKNAWTNQGREPKQRGMDFYFKSNNKS